MTLASYSPTGIHALRHRIQVVAVLGFAPGVSVWASSLSTEPYPTPALLWFYNVNLMKTRSFLFILPPPRPPVQSQEHLESAELHLPGGDPDGAQAKSESLHMVKYILKDVPGGALRLTVKLLSS